MLLNFKDEDSIEYKFERLIKHIRAEYACSVEDFSGYSKVMVRRGMEQLRQLVKENPSLRTEKYERFLEEMPYL